MNKKLIECSYKLIEEENLPKPDSIKIHSPLYGYPKRGGTCFKKITGTNYKILVYDIKSKFVKCPNGKYRDKDTNERFRKAFGEKRPFIQVIQYMAHEIGHLKFWNHGPEHNSYTNHLFERLLEKLSVRNLQLTEE